MFGDPPIFFEKKRRQIDLASSLSLGIGCGCGCGVWGSDEAVGFGLPVWDFVWEEVDSVFGEVGGAMVGKEVGGLVGCVDGPCAFAQGVQVLGFVGDHKGSRHRVPEAHLSTVHVHIMHRIQTIGRRYL